MTSAADMTLHVQLMALLDVLNQRRIAYPALVRKGKLRQAEADYRIAATEAAAGTLSSLYEAQLSVRLAPAQIDLFNAWMKRSVEQQQTLELKRKHADGGNDWVLACETVGSTEIIAVARLLSDLAKLALRADLKA